MSEPTVDPAALLRQAADVAPSVLPKEIAALVAWYLNGTADSGEIWPVAPVLAGEVLALAEQQARPGGAA